MKIIFCGTRLLQPDRNFLTFSVVANSSTIFNYQAELHNTHDLLFNRSPSSKKLGERFYGRPILGHTNALYRRRLLFNKLRIDNQTEEVEVNLLSPYILPEFSEFPIFAPRICHLLRSMEEWRPRTFRELFIPGYSKRLDWWVAMFGVFIGIIAILSLGISCYQAVLAQKQVNYQGSTTTTP